MQAAQGNMLIVNAWFIYFLVFARYDSTLLPDPCLIHVRGNMHKLKHRKFHQNMRKNSEHWYRMPRTGWL